MKLNAQIKQRLAQEYVLGTLRGPARARLEKLAEEDPAIRDCINQASAQVNQLAELVQPQTPPPNVWPAIESRLSQYSATADSSSGVMRTTSRFWQGWAIAATLLLAVSVAMQFEWPLPIDTRREFAADAMILVTADADNTPAWFIRADLSRRELRLRAISIPDPGPGRVFQLWLKLEGEDRVRSVGLIPQGGEGTLTINEEIASVLPRAAKFGVSVEPAGGSPTGQPTSTPRHHGYLL